MGMEVRGYEEAMRGFNKLKDELEQAAEDAVNDSTDLLYDESQIRVPKKTGELAKSGRRIYHSQSGPKRSTGIRYGYPGEGPNVLDYAAAVHEILKASHAPPTAAKYVEGPLVEHIKQYHSFAADASEDAVRRAFR
jgi:hypothetical protein